MVMEAAQRCTLLLPVGLSPANNPLLKGRVNMKNHAMLFSTLAAFLAAACSGPDGEATSAAANDGPEIAMEKSAASNAASTASPVIGELGTGVYAADCAAKDSEFTIRLEKSQDGFVNGNVDHAGKSYAGLLTSYSYMGDATPSDFHVAVMFDATNSPVPVPADGDPRIELWKGEAAYYALINGDKAQRLLFCS